MQSTSGGATRERPYPDDAKDDVRPSHPSHAKAEGRMCPSMGERKRGK